jgi:hypothetical protein
MILAVDIRPGASPHVELWQNGNCKHQHDYNTRHTCHRISIRIVLVVHRLNLWRDDTTVFICGQHIPAKFEYVFQLLNHMSTRCPSWSYGLIYDIVWVWPDFDHEHNTLLSHRHEHHNQRDLWQPLQGAFIWNISHTSMRLSTSWKRYMGAHA